MKVISDKVKECYQSYFGKPSDETNKEIERVVGLTIQILKDGGDDTKCRCPYYNLIRSNHDKTI